MSARGLARHYAMLANGGELDGVRVLSGGAIRAASSCRPSSGTRSTASASAARSATAAVRDSGPAPPERLRPRRRRRLVRLRRPDAQAGDRLRQELLHLRHGRSRQPGWPSRARRRAWWPKPCSTRSGCGSRGPNSAAPAPGRPALVLDWMRAQMPEESAATPLAVQRAASRFEGWSRPAVSSSRRPALHAARAWPSPAGRILLKRGRKIRPALGLGFNSCG